MTETNQPPVTATASPAEPRTLVEMLENHVGQHKKPDLFNYKSAGRWHKVSSDDFLARARRLALGLYTVGIRHGDRVAIFAENCHEWTLADAACLLAGAVDVPIYATQAAPQVQYILQDSGARVLFISGLTKFAAVQELLAQCPALEGVVFFAPEGAAEAGVLTLDELEKYGRQAQEERPHLGTALARQTQPDDLATLIYTSGTTGEPKGVMLTHANLISNTLSSSKHLALSQADSALSVLPYAHVFERTAMYMYQYRGITIYYAEALDKIGANLKEVHPTLFIGVPRLFEKIYEAICHRVNKEGGVKAKLFHWAVGVGKEYAKATNRGSAAGFLLGTKYNLAFKLVLSKWKEGMGGRLRYFISGGAALPEDVGYIFQSAGMPILQGYGLTETSPVITANPPDNNRIGSSGRLIPNVEVRIAADGEIEVRGPNVMRGYYNKPDATREVMTPDGWFKTGDIGKLDEDGFLYITDRKKELFKTSGGKYLAPQPVEQKIKESRYVNQAVLIGNGRKFPSALIVPDWSALESYARNHSVPNANNRAALCKSRQIIDLLEKEVAACTPDLAKFEKIKRVAVLEHELTIESGELTPTLKLKRRVIDEKYKDIINDIYASN